MAQREAPNFKFKAVKRIAPIPTWSIQLTQLDGHDREIIQIRRPKNGLWQVSYTEDGNEQRELHWKTRFTYLSHDADLREEVLPKIREWYTWDWKSDAAETELETRSETAWLEYAEYDPEAVAFQEWEMHQGIIH